MITVNTDFWMGGDPFYTFPPVIPSVSPTYVITDQITNVDPYGVPGQYCELTNPGLSTLTFRSTFQAVAITAGVFNFLIQHSGTLRVRINGVIFADFASSGTLSTPDIMATAGQIFVITLEGCSYSFGAGAGTYFYVKQTTLGAVNNAYLEPITASISEDSNGLFADIGIQATHHQDSNYAIGSKIVIKDIFSRDMYTYNVATRSVQSGVLTLVGETLLGELSRVAVKKQILKKGPFIGSNSYPEAALEYLLTQLDIAFLPIPIFYLRSSAGFLRPEIQAVQIAWEKTTPAPSIAQVLDDFMSAFAGYTLRVAASNKLQIVPPEWYPDGTPVAVLSDDDIEIDTYTESADASSVINAQTVISTGWTFVNDTIIGIDQVIDERAYSAMYQPPTAPLIERDFLINDATGAYSSTYQYVLGDAVIVAGQRYRRIDSPGVIGLQPPSAAWANSAKNGYQDAFGIIAVSDDLIFEGSITLDLEMRRSWVYFSSQTGFNYGNDTISPVVILNGANTELNPILVQSQIERGLFYNPRYVYDFWAFWLDNSVIRYALRRHSAMPIPTSSGVFGMDYRLFVTPRSSVWQKSKIAKSGSYNSSSTNPASGLVESVATFGLRRGADINLGVLDVDASTCAAIAESIVRNNLNPDIIINAGIMPPYVVRSEHVGRLIQLSGSNAAAAVLEAYHYQEQHDNGALNVTATARMRITNPIVPSVALADNTGALLVDQDGSVLFTGGSV